MDEKTAPKLSRRAFLRDTVALGASAAGMAVLAACGGAAPTPTPARATTGGGAATTPAATAAAAGQPAGAKKLEIFSWWTNGGEADGLNAMFEVYKQKNAGVEITNATVAGGAGTNAKAVLQTRLAGGKPPDSWQVHAGRETLSYVNAGQLEPLTTFFSDQGFDKAMPQFLLDQLKINGEIWTVPVNIHRSNILWYNVALLKDNNLQPPKTLDDFFTAADALKAKNVLPIAVGGKDKFEASHTFESVLLATFGPDDYVKLWDGTTTLWDDPRATQAIATLNRLFGYANKDRSAIGWSDAMQQVLDGKAAMTIMGDWAHGFALSKGKKVNTDYGWAPAPGTEGVFMWLSDSFGLAKGAPDPEQARAWLALCGSKEGQDAFNPKKGSIPARKDADQSLYTDYLADALKDWSSNKLAGSIQHGVAVNQPWLAAINEQVGLFIGSKDVKALQQGLADAATANAQ